MYRRPKFLETLIEIRQAMALDADYDVDLFAEMVRSGQISLPDPESKSKQDRVREVHPVVESARRNRR